MADLLYAWADLEINLRDNRVGYLQGKRTDFFRDRHPDQIWLVRQEIKKLWLLGFLKVTDIKPRNCSIALGNDFIFYDPELSKFFSNPLSVESKVQPLLNAICTKLIKYNYEGMGASDVVDNPDVIKLKKLTRDEPTISFEEMSNLVNAGDASGFPYLRSKNVAKSSSGSRKNQAIPPATSPSFPLNPLNKTGGSTTPEEDENRRKKQAENGALGELLAMEYECERLKKLGCLEPLKFANHIALKDTGAGYDIESSWNNEERFIEVKTSQTGREEFFISANEVETLRKLGKRGWLYLVDLSKQNEPSGCVEEKENAGEQLSSSYSLTATQFRATLKG